MSSETPPLKKRRTGRPAKQDAVPGQDARTVLLHAAGAEFVEHGYVGTSTARIAQRAGFSPQTFYRWYKDKLDVFVEVYRSWAQAEMATLEAMLTERAASLHIAEACVQSHQSFLTFKRSLHELALEAPEVRQARAESRRAQIRRVAHWQPGLSDEDMACLLIGIDHLCQALAEGEYTDLGLSGREAYAQLASMIERLRPALP